MEVQLAVIHLNVTRVSRTLTERHDRVRTAKTAAMAGYYSRLAKVSL